MLKITIKPGKNDKNEPCTFFLNWNIDGTAFIASESPSLGFMIRNDMTESRLFNHLAAMQKERCKVIFERV